MKTRFVFAMMILCAVALKSALSSALPPQETVQPFPKPATSAGMSLNEALAKRRSCRQFTDRPVTSEQLGQICWAAQGITEPVNGLRTAPSAMHIYPVRVYVADSTGLREYLPKEHGLRTLRSTDAIRDLRTMPEGAPALGGATTVLVVCMNPGMLEARAGKLAERFALLESGHVTQNILLEATALGLASVTIGGIDEAKIAAALKLPEGFRPVYVMPLGAPAGS